MSINQRTTLSLFERCLLQIPCWSRCWGVCIPAEGHGKKCYQWTLATGRRSVHLIIAHPDGAESVQADWPQDRSRHTHFTYAHAQIHSSLSGTKYSLFWARTLKKKKHIGMFNSNLFVSVSSVRRHGVFWDNTRSNQAQKTSRDRHSERPTGLLDVLCLFVNETLNIKWALCGCGDEIQTQQYFFSHNWIKKLPSEENKIQELSLKLERWQGPPHINKVKQYETVLSFKLSLFIQSWKRGEAVCLFSLFRHKKKRSEKSFSSD